MEQIGEFDELFQLAPLPMWVYEFATLKIVEVNQAALESYGYQRDEFLRLTLFDLRATLDQPELLRVLASWTLPVAHEGVYRHVLKGGSVITVSVHSRPIQFRGTESCLMIVIPISNTSAPRAEPGSAPILAEREAILAEGALAIDGEWRITSLNPRAIEFLDTGTDDVIGKKFLDAFPEAVGSVVERAYATTLRDKTTQQFEFYYARRGVYFSAHVFPVDAGLVMRFADVSASRRAAEELRSSHDLFTLVAEATNDVMWDWNLRQATLGKSVPTAFSRSDHLAHSSDGSWASHLHPHDRDAMTESVQKALAGVATNWTGEYRFARADGSYAHVLDRAIILRGRDGHATRMSGAMQDVSRVHENELALRRFERIAHAVPDGIVVVDALQPDYPIIFMNPAFEEITGYGAADVMGRNCRFLQNGETDQEALSVLRAAIAENRQARVVLRNYRKDGTLFWNQLIVAPVRDADGAVVQYVGIVCDVTEPRRIAAELERLSGHDILTGLLNRRTLEDRLGQELIRAERNGLALAVLFIGLDHFNIVNQGLGHGAGDEVLHGIAQRLSKALPSGATVARSSGDEFVAVCVDLPARLNAETLAVSIIQALAAPIDIGPHKVPISASMGVALFPEDGGDALDLIRRANAAMLEAKRSARGGWRLHRAGMEARLQDHLALENDLRRALERDEFELFYQLQTDTLTGSVVGAEALIRWRRPDGRYANPIEFLPIAENSGLIVPIGNWVLAEACRQAKAWRDANLSDLTISVNVSIVQFRRDEFVDDVRTVLDESGLLPRYLELEITETIALEGVEQFIVTLDRLKALGVRIALDDFGTGFSSLTHLRRFAVDTLKIDRSFVHDITTDAKDAAICRTIIAMAHNLGMQAIAEGVETRGHASYLARHNCDRLQGYLLHRPAPAAEVRARLEDRAPFYVPDVFGERVSNVVLIVDDDELTAQAYCVMLERHGFKALAADSPGDAFEQLAMHRIDVVIADERMPSMRGGEFLLIVKDLYPESVRMLLSAYADADVIAHALNRAGIFRYLPKGSTEKHFVAQVREAFESLTRNATT